MILALALHTFAMTQQETSFLEILGVMLMMDSRESINRTPTAEAPKATFINLKECLN